MADIELSPWVSDSPAMQVPDDLLRQSINRALIDFALRRENEKLLFQSSNDNYLLIIYNWRTHLFLYWEFLNR